MNSPEELEDTNPGYWDKYSNLQRVKHDLIRNYLNAWFPKLGSWHGRIVYFDTHAGRGKHTGGQYGSPIVALKTLATFEAKCISLVRGTISSVERG